jgi:hypothetical protein
MSTLARDLWRVVEPFHQLAYRSPAATQAYGDLGLVRPDQQYFANRLAAAGPIGAQMAVALLYGFAPRYVQGAVPEIWSITTPAAVSAARADAAHETLVEVVEPVADVEMLDTAARTARRLVDATDLAGRPLAAAHADLAWPTVSGPMGSAMVLWHACTILREHRGDAHWAITSAHEIDPMECHVLHAADGAMPPELLQRVSGWDDEAWSAASHRLIERGLVTGDGAEMTLTNRGRQCKWDIEHHTDREAGRSIAIVGDAEVANLMAAMRPWVDQIIGAEVVGAWKLREQLWRDLGDRPH